MSENGTSCAICGQPTPYVTSDPVAHPKCRDSWLASIRSRVYARTGQEVGELVEDKQRQYGDSVGKTGRILAILSPDGVRPDQYDDMLLTVRVLDKLSRISQRGPDGQDLGGESPWRDVAGYGVLGTVKDAGSATRDEIADEAQERDLLDLLRKLASGEGGRRTGKLARRGWLRWEVTEEGRRVLEDEEGVAKR